ncbi:glycosyltransferase 61 family protein [Vibrio sp. 1159]|uniref:glycosyltransferase 61 family protein n=1 Tax=Vibrio sp. 1159 TaxID=3074545 RepID=UPI0029649B3D|nr:glycosyltransferase 61 family protein [Vibrio sp. 1159]MDW2323891.1 glycosyltransferase 61 family protein [Vibrio sp. 1159]
MHYGHFLLESLSRLSHYNGEKNIIWVGVTNNRKKFQEKIFNILGLEDVNHIYVTGSVTCERLNVSEREYIIWDKFSKYHYDFLSVNDRVSESFYNENVWLSRSGFDTYENEFIIETLLLMRGWRILNLEELEFEEQVSIFNSCKKIAGIEGTAFHNMIFSKLAIDDISIFSRRRNNPVNGNYRLISSVVNNKHKFFTPKIDPTGCVDVNTLFECLGLELNDTDYRVIKTLENKIKTPMKRPHLLNRIRSIATDTADRFSNISKEMMDIFEKYN